MTDWEKRLLGEIAEYSKSRINTDNLTLDNYVSTTNMLTEKAGKVQAVSIPSGTAVKFTEGQTLVSNIRPYFKKIWQADTNGGCSSDVLVFDIKKDIDKDYFFYYLSQDMFFDYVMAGSKGTKMPRGDKQQILKFPFSYPEKKEQKAIAATLSCLDDKIELNNRMNQTLEEMAQALFKSWFVDFEPFQDGEFVDSELGMIPKGWSVDTLESIAIIIMGQSPRGSSYNEEKNGEVFYQGRTDFGNRYPKRRLYTTEPKKMAKQKDILMSVRAPVGDINQAYENCCIGRGLCAIRSKNQHDSFLFHLMKSLETRLKVYDNEGTVFGSINKTTLGNIKIIIPPKKVIEEFENIVEKIDTKYLFLSKQIKLLNQLRNTLLPKLMSGEVRVPIPEVK